MKNTLTVIEKITLTFLAITFPMFVIGIFVGSIWGNETIGLYLVLPFAICIGIIATLAFIFELLLCRIWGLDLHVFPTLFKE
jgi:ABC-type transport system involved in cytochrome c biogenesis permease subunit